MDNDTTPEPIEEETTVPVPRTTMRELVYGPEHWDGTNGVDDRRAWKDWS